MKYQAIRVRIPNEKGQKLASEIYKPEKSGKMPAAIILHGFTGYKESADLVDLADRLAQQGIVSIRFTSSGFGDSEGTLEQDNRLSNHRSDTKSIYAYISKLPYVDVSRLGVYGHSMGGKLAVLFCSDKPNIKAVCIFSAPVTFFATSYGTLEKDWKKSGFLQKVSSRGQKLIRVPYAYFIDAEKKRTMCW